MPFAIILFLNFRLSNNSFCLPSSSWLNFASIRVELKQKSISNPFL